jgi:tetratricopeptide (TPR) repeat protein
MGGVNLSAGGDGRSRLRLGFRLLIGLVLIGLVLWRLPRFVGGFKILQDLRRLDQAIASVPRDNEAVSEATVALLAAIERYETLDESALAMRMTDQGRVTQASILVGVARYYADRGQPDKALEAYRSATAIYGNGISDAVYLEFYELATQVDPTDGRARTQLIRYLELNGETDRMRDELLNAIQNAEAWGLSDAWLADALYRLGMRCEDEGNTEGAISGYRQALELDSRVITAMARLAAIYERDGDADQAELWKRRLAELKPDYAVGQDVGDGWYLVGYDLDEQELQDSREIDIWLYWVSASPYETSTPGWYRAGDRWVQLTTVYNQAFNGGFEQGKAGAFELPLGWYITQDSQVELPARALAERGGAETFVASLRGPGIVALCAEHYARTPNAIYLHSAWVRSDGTTAADVGCVWNVAGSNAWTYIIREARDTVWTHYAGIEALGEGATGCRPCVYKRGEGGEVQFDDVLLVSLEPPGYSQEQ